MDNDDIKRFFEQTQANIHTNVALREPQKDAYVAIRKHFELSSAPCYVQIPVGCGKTGLMGITPFDISDGRVLIVTPNLTVRKTVMRDLDVSSPNCFYSKRGVFEPTDGPYLSELKVGANIHDCDNAHLVVGNIQQFAGENNRWYEQFPSDYFRMILVDEGHHNVAETWRRLFDYFADAKVVSYTATPQRSDGQRISGERVYSFGYCRSMMLGYISPIDAVLVAPREITFTVMGETHTLSLQQVLEMRENDWFSKGIALSEECNRNIVLASIQQLSAVRQHGEPRQIIANACSIRHASQICGLYQEYGLTAEVLHSKLSNDERDRVEAALRSGLLDVVVQVQMLGEGYDLRSLSVAAIFRPYRSLSPYIQFIGRILRLADAEVPFAPGNKVYVVSHVGLNDEHWWEDFTNFDKEDQDFFAEYLGSGEMELTEDETCQRRTLRPFMRVLNETIDSYIQKGFLGEIDAVMVQDVIQTIRSKGYDPEEFGLTEETVLQRLQLASQAQRETAPYSLLAQPQRKREALRKRMQPEARAIADTVINRLGLEHRGKDLVRHYPKYGPHNAAILISLAQAAQNRAMGVQSGQRDSASIQQFELGLAASANIADGLTTLIKAKMKIGETNAKD